MGTRTSVLRRLGLLVVICATVVAATGTNTAAHANDVEVTRSAAAAQSLERDSVLMRVDVLENGTAEWHVEYRTRLDDAETTAAFESLQKDIREDPSAYSSDFFGGIDRTVATASNATGRQMSGSNYDVHTELRYLPQRYGVVVYSFRWEGFAAVDGNELRIGDALSGFFLGESERLMVSWPAEYETATVRPTPDVDRSGSAVWIGPADFDDDEPRVRLERPVAGPHVPGWLAPAALLVLLGLAGGALWTRRDGGTRITATADGGTEADEPAPELLSNEERVLRLLERRGGRAKQQDVVDELGWTEAKTSQVIGALREQGDIESFRLGRENVLSVPRMSGDEIDG